MKVKNEVIKVVLDDAVTPAQAEEITEIIASILDLAGLGYAIFGETEEEDIEEAGDGEEE